MARSRLGFLLIVAVAILAAAGFAAARLARSAPSGLVAACHKVSGDERRVCYERLLSDRLRTAGVGDAFTTLDRLAADDPDVAEHAHEYSHGIGIEAYGLSKDIPATFTECGDGFSSGCRHGVIQAYFEARDQVSAAEVDALCKPFKSSTASRWVLFQCVHGMGHGLTMFHGHDLPRALTDCDLLSDGWDRESCYGGVFMENVINATAPHHPATEMAAQGHHHMAATPFKAINADDPLYPCSISAERYWHACYQMQTSVMLFLNHGDIGEAAKTCDTAPARMRTVCHQSLGRDITSYTARDPQKTADMCEKSSEPFRPSCYIGAAKALVDWTATTDAAIRFCAIVANEPGGPTCFRALGEEIATLLAGQPDREAQCNRAAAPAAIAACRQGAGLPASR
jgi:hypothetical protein